MSRYERLTTVIDGVRLTQLVRIINDRGWFVWCIPVDKRGVPLGRTDNGLFESTRMISKATITTRTVMVLRDKA